MPTSELARLQPFVTSNWLGGLYGSPSMAGTRPGGPIAAGWAVLQHLGEDGYLRLADDAWRAAATLRAAVGSTPGIALRGSPDMTVLAFGDDGTDTVDTFALGDALAERGGWYFDRQTPPDSLHATVHAGHLAVIDELRADLTAAAADVADRGVRSADRSHRGTAPSSPARRPPSVATPTPPLPGPGPMVYTCPTGGAGGGDLVGGGSRRTELREIVVDRKWWTLIAVCFGTFMLLLDITVVNVALPDIQIALHSTFADLQWVVDAYALTLAAFLLTAGVLGDMYGRRGMFAIGLVLFSLASLTCGLATTPLMLNLSRAAQGVGGAIMFATSLALIAQAFAGKERGTAIGVYGAVIGRRRRGRVRSSAGPSPPASAGGGSSSSTSPSAIVAVIITLTKVDNAKIQTGRRIDWLGFVTFTSSLFLLVYALVQGNAKGWGSTYIVSMLVGLGLLMTVFIIGEWQQRDPMLDLALFKRPAMVGVSLGSFTLSASIFAMFLYLTLYMQEVLGYSALCQAGLRFLPLTMLAFIVAPIAGKLTVRVQTRFLMGLGLLLVAVGCDLMSHVAGDSSWTVLLPGFLVCGIGVGLTNPVLASGVVSVVPPERSGMSSGAASTFRQVGIATGIAGLGAIFVHQIKPGGGLQPESVGGRSGGAAPRRPEPGAAPSPPAACARWRRRSRRPPPARPSLSAYQDGFASTFNHLMGIASVIALVGAVGCLFLVRQKDFVPSIGAGEWTAPKAADGDGAATPTGVAADGGVAAAGSDEGPTPASPARAG